jgi:hypothetical protein
MKAIFSLVALAIVSTTVLATPLHPVVVPKPTPIVVVPHSSLFGPSPAIPSIYADGLTRLQLPNLTSAEKAAYSQMEALQQLGEVYVQAYGCPASPISGGVDVYSDDQGTGDATLWTPGGALKMYTSRTAFDSFRGSVQTVKMSSGTLNARNFVGLVGNYRFNKPGSIMEGDAVMSVPNSQAGGTADVFTGKVIKDFFGYLGKYEDSPRLFILDWGLQVVNKKGYPVSKWYQHSWSIRDDGVEGNTVFEKVRIAGGIPCSITVSTNGLNNTEQFNEQGTFSIKKYVGIALPNVK